MSTVLLSRLAAASLVSAVAFIGAGCVSRFAKTSTDVSAPVSVSTNAPATAPAPDEPPPVPPVVPGPEAAQKTFTITARQWSFSPQTVTVRQGDSVKLVITSIDVSHGFAMPLINANKRLEPGKSVTVEFVADQKGKFPYFCNVYCGNDHNAMRGYVVVE